MPDDLKHTPVTAQPQPVVNQQMTTAARDVLAERQRQIEAEGWTTEHDDSHHTGEMALAAGCYAMYAHHPDYYGTGPRENRVPRMWPWAEKWWKQASPRRNLVKAGALILAEIERLDRAAHEITATSRSPAAPTGTAPAPSHCAPAPGA